MLSTSLPLYLIINFCRADPKEELRLFDESLKRPQENNITIHFGNTAFIAILVVFTLIQIYIFRRCYLHRRNRSEPSQSNDINLKSKMMMTLQDIQKYVDDNSEESDSTHDETSNDETDTSDISDLH